MNMKSTINICFNLFESITENHLEVGYFFAVKSHVDAIDEDSGNGNLKKKVKNYKKNSMQNDAEMRSASLKFLTFLFDFLNFCRIHKLQKYIMVL